MTTATALGAWLATYAIHSTILLTVTLVATRFIRSEAAKEILWKAAVVGGLLTSALPAVAGYTPAVGNWTIANEPRSVVSQLPGTASNPPASREATSRTESAPARALPVVEPGTGEDATRNSHAWLPLLVGGWLVISLLLVIRMLLHQRRLFSALSDRRLIKEGALPGMLAELRRKSAIWAPVRLSASPACPTPIALGRLEICVPQRFANDLDAEQQRTALAHELAHLKRHDPTWQLAVGLLECIFFFQPLNAVGRRRMRDAAEYLCDDWAVQQTGSPMVLARCLTQIGSWVGSAAVPDGMLAIAEGGSPLVSRIQRLVEWTAPRGGSARPSLALATALIALVATAAPVFSAADAPSLDDVPAGETPQIRPPQSAAPDSVIDYSDPRVSFQQRHERAHAGAGGAPYWVGWEIRTVPAHAGPITSSSKGVPQPDETAPILAALLGAQPPRGERAAVLLRFNSPTDLSAVRFQRLDQRVILGGRRLSWLGMASTGESLSQLRTLYRAEGSARLRAELAAAYTIHADPEAVIRLVRDLLGADGTPAVRAEAVQWLARLQGEDGRTITLLTEVALTDEAIDVRVEAVDGLRGLLRSGNSAARAALSRIANSDAHARVRSEAMQALAGRT